MLTLRQSENYGWHKGSTEAGDAKPLLGEKIETHPTDQKPKPKSALRLAFEGTTSSINPWRTYLLTWPTKDKRILVLGLTSCFFEGSLFLFIFFKFPALKLSHQLAGSTGGAFFRLSPFLTPILADNPYTRTLIRSYFRDTYVVNDAGLHVSQLSQPFPITGGYQPTPYFHPRSRCHVLLHSRLYPCRSSHPLVLLSFRGMLRGVLSSYIVSQRADH